MTDLTYLTEEQVKEFREKGKLEEPVHEVDIATGVGEDWEMFYSLMVALGFDKFKPHTRFNAQVERLARKHDCNAVMQKHHIMQMTVNEPLDRTRYEGHIEFYKI